MSTIHAGLYEYLSNQIGIVRLVGSRISEASSPAADVYPRITYQRTDKKGEHHFNAAAGLAKATFQISCFDEDSVRVNTVSEAVRNALDGMPSGTKWGPHGEFTTRGVSLTGEQDIPTPPTNNSETMTYHVAMDFEVWYTETVPTFA